MRTTRQNGSRRTNRSHPKPRLKLEPSRDLSAAASEDVARYIADMTVQLASMASGAKLELLAYFLKMAHAECVSQFRPRGGAVVD